MLLVRALPVLALSGALLSGSAFAATDDLLRMSEQLDRLDRADMQDMLDKAGGCTRARDFACAEAELQRAAGLAVTAGDKQALARATARLAAERRALADEERALAEQERQLQLAEERLQRQEAQARRDAEAQEEQGMSTGQAVALFGSLVAQSYGNQAALRAAEAARNTRNFQAMQAQVAAGLQQQQQRFAEERARIAAQRAALQPVASSRRVVPASTATTVSGGLATGSPAGVRSAEAAGGLSAEARLGMQNAGIPLAALAPSAPSSQDRAAAGAGTAVQAPSSATPTARSKADAETARLEKEKAEQLAIEREREQSQQRQEQRRAELQAKRDAEKAEAERARQDYLAALTSGTRLHARKCPDGEGKYYVVGLRPKLKEVVGCVDLHYRAQCPDGRQVIDGVGKNFIGVATDCFMGDTYTIDPKPACKVEDVRVTVREVRACGE